MKYFGGLDLLTVTEEEVYIQNLQTSQGFILVILQHFATTLDNSTNFGMFV